MTDLWVPRTLSATPVRGGRICKVVSFPGPGAQSQPVDEFPSKQLIEDPFATLENYGVGGFIIEPPYSMEQLVLLAEQYPIHGAAIEQKVEDIISDGPELVPAVDNADPDQQKALMAWLDDLCEDYTLVEMLQAAWGDYETVGWGTIEISRDVNGIARRMWHIPGHTMRAVMDSKRLLQYRAGRQRWFKRWGVDQDYYMDSGAPADPNFALPDEVASEVMVIKKPTRRSTWYGIPVYVSSIGHIALGIAARDYNVLFFENAREARHIFIITGLDEEVDQMVDDLAMQLSTQHADPHRNLILPIVGDAKVQIVPMAATNNDMQFVQLSDNCTVAILMSHRMPGDRLGVAGRGMLGGSIAEITNRIYKDGVVSRGQQILENRLNRFMTIEFNRMNSKVGPDVVPLDWKIDFNELDITDEKVDTDIVCEQVRTDLVTLNEGRKRLGLARNDAFGDMTLQQYLVSIGVQPGPSGVGGVTAPSAGGTKMSTGSAMKSRDLMQLQEYVVERLDNVDALCLDLMTKPEQDRILPAA